MHIYEKGKIYNHNHNNKANQANRVNRANKVNQVDNKKIMDNRIKNSKVLPRNQNDY